MVSPWRGTRTSAPPHSRSAAGPPRRRRRHHFWVGAQDQEEHGPRTPCRANARASTTTSTRPLLKKKHPHDRDGGSNQRKGTTPARIRFFLFEEMADWPLRCNLFLLDLSAHSRIASSPVLCALHRHVTHSIDILLRRRQYVRSTTLRIWNKNNSPGPY